MKKIIIEIDLNNASENAIDNILGEDGIMNMTSTYDFIFTEKTENFKNKTLTYKMQSINNQHM